MWSPRYLHVGDGVMTVVSHSTDAVTGIESLARWRIRTSVFFGFTRRPRPSKYDLRAAKSFDKTLSMLEMLDTLQAFDRQVSSA